MRNRTIMLVCALFLLPLLAAAETTTLSSEKDKRSYSIGLNAGRNMKKSLQMQPIDLDLKLVQKGISDAFLDAKPLLSDEEMQTILTALQKEMTTKQQEKAKEASEKNKKEGEAFLESNKKRADVKTLPSGLQYKVLADGKGKSPKPTDIVHVQYRGTLVDGTEFDSSYKRGQAAVFPVNGVIRGWTEALQLMKEGSKWQLFIPSDLAYGDRGMGGQIGPNAVLIFEVELVSIAKPEKQDKK